jgi:hypothetical protein
MMSYPRPPPLGSPLPNVRRPRARMEDFDLTNRVNECSGARHCSSGRMSLATRKNRFFRVFALGPMLLDLPRGAVESSVVCVAGHWLIK